MLRRLFGVAIALIAWYNGMGWKSILAFGLLALVVLFVVVPYFFRYSASLQRHMVFLPWVNWPRYTNFETPTDYHGLQGAINYYFETEPQVRVGVWHVVPSSLIEESEGKDRSWFDEKLGRSGHPVFLYLHGNTGSRARDHRVALYRVLQSLGCHVIAFDYRGYADSSRVMPTKTGVIHDARKLYEHIKNMTEDKATPIFIYGHSLGTAVSTQLVSELCQEAGGLKGDQRRVPVGLVLESPFNNISDEIKLHPMAFLWRKMPWFDWFFVDKLAENDVGFVSDQHIVHIHIPILILHAKDDLVVPFELGEKLYKVGLNGRPLGSGPIEFVAFGAERGLGHIQMFSAEETPGSLRKFVEQSISFRRVALGGPQ